MTSVSEYVRATKSKFRETFGHNPQFRNFSDMTSEDQESMARANLIARQFDVMPGDFDTLLVLVQCKAIDDLVERYQDVMAWVPRDVVFQGRVMRVTRTREKMELLLTAEEWM